jgi:PAS domain S-box-containing protein
MKPSIRTKLLTMCILLVLLTTVAISGTYYVLTKQDKQRESRQRIQIAFDIILDDLADRVQTYREKSEDFLKNDRTLPLIPSVYSQDENQIGSATFIVSFLVRLAQKTQEFGHIVPADRTLVYAANRRLLAFYQNDNDQELVGGYVVSETGSDAYFPLDDFSQVSTWLVVNHKPIPDAPLPVGITAYYEGEIPESISTSLFSEGQMLGLRIVAPLYEGENIVGILVCDIAYTQAMVNRYASLSKTDVNFFAGSQVSVGTLQTQAKLAPEDMEQIVSCEDLLNRQKEPKISVLRFDQQEYYQGQCLLKDTHDTTIGAISVNLSREIEKQRIRKILTTVLTISGVGIVMCIILVLGILVPTFTRPIIKLTNASLNMAKGDLQQPIDTSGTDELGTLARSFAYMRDEIQKKQEALQKFTEDLEQRVKERTAEITRQKYIFDTFMENVPDSIYFKDLNSRIIQANKAHAVRFGLRDPAEGVGKTDFDFFPEELAQVKYAQEQGIICTGQPLLAMEEPDVRGTWSLTTKMPLRDEHGKIIGTFGVSTDISKLKQTEKALRQAKDIAEEARQVAESANQAKSEFLANMSHELRTPLNVILGLAQIMARNHHISEEERENLDIIRRSGEHLLTLINSVLDMSKIEAGQISINETNIDLFCLLDELEEMFYRRATQKRLHLMFERADNVPQYICTDATKLRQVLMNLLNNAMKFTEEGGVMLRVKSVHPPTPLKGGIIASIERPNSPLEGGRGVFSSLHFEVEDTGPGIASDEVETLFEAFRQTQTGRRAQEGTGLGLTISREFVQMMGGEMTVQSEVGRGTTFIFALPIRVVGATDVTPPPLIRRVITLEPGQPRYRILVVDDKPANRHLLVKLLRPLGFDVREAANGQEAIEIWEGFAPHLIWMDMRMPVMDGYEATRYIKSEIQNSKSKIQTVIIALTASSVEDEQAITLSIGCDNVVRKPFREEEIFAIMHKHLGVRYVYEEGEGQRAKGEREMVELTPTDLAALPNEIYTELQQAVNTANLKAMQRLIERVQKQNVSLANTLTALVNQFRFDILQAVFNQNNS